ncbi:MAG: ABC transporter ATP-binding protein [Fusobacterium sp.]|uniref:ABC transporter ATP-binding protein n=1 Tax=Fusobacterium sp. TaxID=68766 RepID=UPI0026DBE811|nr:ABC transporter ATP-binding protein [Fusobacterium sp.]MDO4690391.1 ABC transporter ATP-binding protein [Fusobacterium sp.]
MNILEVNNITYKIDSREILKNLSFKVKKSEIIGVIGPNGSGKTSLLKALNRINSIDSGEILIENKNIKKYREKDLAKKISFMNQNTNLTFDFPCIDVVVLGRYPYLERFEEYGKSDVELAEKYMKLTDTLKFRDKSILEISGGERQRVLFAKVLTQETDITLLDEPFSSMDMLYEEELFKYVESMKDIGKTVISVVHNLRMAIKYCTRLILLHNGEILKDGRPLEVITEENLNRAFSIKTKVYHNEISNCLDFHIL